MEKQTRQELFEEIRKFCRELHYLKHQKHLLKVDRDFYKDIRPIVKLIFPEVIKKSRRNSTWPNITLFLSYLKNEELIILKNILKRWVKNLREDKKNKLKI